MKLNTDSEFFLEGFCKTCEEQGLDEQTTGDLYHQARLTEAQTRPAFSEGFREGLQTKQAKIPIKGIAKALGLGGAGVAAAPALSGANPLDAIKGPGGPIKTPGLNLPSWRPELTDSASAAVSGRGQHNPFSYIEGYAQPGASTDQPDHPLSLVNNARDRIKRLDEQIQGLQGQDAGDGLAGTLAAGRTRQVLKQLQRERAKAVRQMSGTYFGGFSRDVARGEEGVGEALGRTEERLGRIRSKAENLNDYLQKTQGSLLAAPWNALTNVRGRAQGVLSRQSELERQLEYLRQRQAQLQAL